MSSSSSSTTNQPPWVPSYMPTKDCSQGFCSIYCPQWCYFLFPPPPSFSSTSANSDAGSGPIFSPLVIAIIGILASAFLLISYYALVSKYCTSFRHSSNTSSSNNQTANNGSDHSAAWHVSPSNGLDASIINKIAVWKYKAEREGNFEISDCSVCLSEFREGEDLRLLPKCAHAFHVQCIDTWFKSHSNCPLCRASIVPAQHEEARADEIVVIINDTNTTDGGNEEEIIELREELEEGRDRVRRVGRSLSMDSNREDGAQMSIADVLRLSMEDELLVAKENGLLGRNSAGYSRRCLSMQNKDALHCGPVPMKRSLSSGRVIKNGSRRERERDDVLPIWHNSSSDSNR